MNIALRRMARRVAKVGAASRAGVVLRLLLGLALLEGALWAPVRVGMLIGVAALWFMAWQLRRAAGTMQSLGLAWRGLGRELRPLALALAISLSVLGLAYYSGTLHRLFGLRQWWWAVAAYGAWALIQEFMLQCFCMRMLRAMVSRVTSVLLCGAVFAVAHLPNLSLMLITFIGGVAFSAIYARRKNLYAVALIHAVLGLTLAVSAPEEWFHGLSVGRGFLERPAAVAVSTSER